MSEWTAYFLSQRWQLNFFSPCFRQKCFLIPERSRRALDGSWLGQLLTGQTYTRCLAAASVLSPHGKLCLRRWSCKFCALRNPFPQTSQKNLLAAIVGAAHNRPVASNPGEFMETGGNGSSLFGNRGLGGGGESGGRNSPGAGGGDNRRLRLLQQPLHSLSVGLVTQFPSKLKDPGGTESRHANSPTSSIDLFVSILVRTPLRSNLKLLVIVVVNPKSKCLSAATPISKASNKNKVNKRESGEATAAVHRRRSITAAVDTSRFRRQRNRSTSRR
nr:unnamed protein product [Ipomoea batatas]